MSLPVLLLLVVGGIVGIAILLHQLGLSNPRIFEDEKAIRQVWMAEYPGQAPSSLQISRNGHYALVRTAQGLGLVWPMGMDGTARLLLGAEVTPTRKGLVVDLPDFTAPRIHLKLDPDEARNWQATIEGAR